MRFYLWRCTNFLIAPARSKGGWCGGKESCFKSVLFYHLQKFVKDGKVIKNTDTTYSFIDEDGKETINILYVGAARAYLHNAINTGEKSFLCKDPYCPIDFKVGFQNSTTKSTGRLVHMDYLCTWIGKPK